MALVFVGQGLLPGSHAVELRLVLVQDAMGLREARPPCSVRPTRSSTTRPRCCSPFARFTKDKLPDVPLWNPHIMTGRPFEADGQSGDLLAVQRARLRAAVLHRAGLDHGAEALGRRVRDVPARPRAWHADRRARCSPGSTYGFCLWEVTWHSYPHASGLGADPAAAVVGRPRDPPPRRARRVAAGRADRRAAAVRPPRVELPRARSRPSCSACCGDRPARAVAAAAAGVRRCDGVSGFALAAVAVLPFLELLCTVADITSGRARRSPTMRR